MTRPNRLLDCAGRACLSLVVSLLVGCGGGGGGNPGGGGPTNHSPTITSAFTPTPSLVDPGGVVQLSVGASDADGDALSYAWSQVPAAPAGTFSAQAASTTWTAPTVTSGTSFQLRVSVSDGRGGSVAGRASLYVKTGTVPSFAADVEPIFDRANDPPRCAACHSGTGAYSPHLEPSLEIGGGSRGSLAFLTSAAPCRVPPSGGERWTREWGISF